jgi:hypothetical protein
VRHRIYSGHASEVIFTDSIFRLQPNNPTLSHTLPNSKHEHVSEHQPSQRHGNNDIIIDKIWKSSINNQIATALFYSANILRGAIG